MVQFSLGSRLKSKEKTCLLIIMLFMLMIRSLCFRIYSKRNIELDLIQFDNFNFFKNFNLEFRIYRL